MIHRTEPHAVSEQDREFCWDLYRGKSKQPIKEREFDYMVADAAARKAPLAALLGMPQDGRLYIPLQPTPEDLIATPEWRSFASLGYYVGHDRIPPAADVLKGYHTLPGDKRPMRIGRVMSRLLKDVEVPPDQLPAVERVVYAAANLSACWGLVSLNPVDCLLASELAPGWGDEANYSSCFRILGQYANVTIQMARSSRVGIVYTVPMLPYERKTGTMDTYRNPPWFRDKLARTWLHLPVYERVVFGKLRQEYRLVWLARNYGDMAEGHARQIAEALASRLAWRQGLHGEWERQHYGVTISHAIYSDDDVTYALRLPPPSSGQQKSSALAAAMCLQCGDTHRDVWGSDHSDGQSCASCVGGNEEDQYYCANCGNEAEEGNEYCDSCGGACEHCDNEFANSGLNDAHGRDGDVRVCDDCLSNKYTQCAVCDEYRRDQVVSPYYVDGESYTTDVCDDCVDNGYHACANACTETLISNSDESDLCPGCIAGRDEQEDESDYPAIQDHPNQLTLEGVQ